MSADLASLSNDQLRIRLLEYGFQNLPITQTTRKVLVKKLSNAIEKKNMENRRETIAIMKSSDDEDIEEAKRAAKREKTPNRRATIGVVEKARKVPATSSSNGAGSRAETPTKTTTTAGAASSRRSSRATPQKIVTSSVVAMQEDSDENDVIEIPIIRRSKTPTMGKSDTVRTSYKSVVEKAQEEAIVFEVEEPPRSQRSTSRRKTFAAPEIVEKPQARTATPTKLGRSTMTTSFNPSGTYNFKHTATAVNYQEEEEDEDDDDAYNNVVKDAPYLSNFAKRLSTLKAEPIDVGLGKYKSLRNDDDDYNSNKYESTNYRYTQYGNTNMKQKQQQYQRGVVNQMARDFDKLDRKYSVRKYVYIALLIMIVIAIYVLLFG